MSSTGTLATRESKFVLPGGVGVIDRLGVSRPAAGSRRVLGSRGCLSGPYRARLRLALPVAREVCRREPDADRDRCRHDAGPGKQDHGRGWRLLRSRWLSGSLMACLRQTRLGWRSAWRRGERWRAAVPITLLCGNHSGRILDELSDPRRQRKTALTSRCATARRCRVACDVRPSRLTWLPHCWGRGAAGRGHAC